MYGNTKIQTYTKKKKLQQKEEATTKKETTTKSKYAATYVIFYLKLVFKMRTTHLR